MSATVPEGAAPGWLAGWAVCFAAVLALHAGGLALLLTHLPPPEPPHLPPEAVLLDLPPSPPEPAPTPAPPPPAAPPAPAEPAPTPPDPEPPRPVELPEPPPLPPTSPVVAPEVVLPRPPPPPPRPPVVRRPRPPAAVAHKVAPPLPTAAPSVATAAAPQEAVPARAAPAAPSPPSDAVPTWRGELVRRLQQAKRYPADARSRGEQGVAFATFTIDRNGHVLAAALARSSGSAALDEEAVAMIHRADPLPAMPAEMGGSSVTLTVPVNFAIR